MKGLARGLTLLVALLLAAPAHADEAALARWLPASAPAVLRVDAPAIEAALELGRTARLPGLAGRGLMLARFGARAVLGFDPTRASGWRAAGFDVTAPILVAIADFEPTATTAAYAARVGGAAGDPVFWRTRLVWRVVDPGRAAATVERLLDLAPGRRFAAGQPDLVVARHLAPGLYAVARIDGDVLVVDLLLPFGAATDADALRAARASPAASFAERLGPGATVALARPGIVLWADPARLLELWVALSQSRAVATPGPTDTPPDAAAACAPFLALASSGPVADAAFIATPSARQLELRIQWALRSGHGLTDAITTADDQLLPRELPADAVAIGALHFASLAPLTKLPRAPVLAGGPRQLVRALRACGTGATVILAAVAWPDLLAAAAGDIASIDPLATRLIEHTRNLAVAVQRAAINRADLVATAEVSFAPSAPKLLEPILTAFFGKQHRLHNLTVWGQGPVRAYRRPKTPHPTYGLAHGPQSLRWRTTLPKSPSPLTPPPLAWLTARPNHLAHLTPPSLHRLLSSISTLTLHLHHQKTSLEAHLTLTP